MKVSLSAFSLSLAFLAATAAPIRSQCATWAEGFGPGGLNGKVNAFAVYDDGSGAKLYAGGDFDEAGGEPSGHVARWNGTRWEALASMLMNRVEALAVYDDGAGPKLYAGGFSVLSGAHMAVWNGTSWSPMTNGPTGLVLALGVFDGSLYAGGNFNSAGGVTSPNIARWNGAIWSSVGGSVGLDVTSFAVYDDGAGPALFIAGQFNQVGGIPASGVARWNGAQWSALGTGTSTEVLALAVHDFGSGPMLVAGGRFASIGGVSASMTARWNGSAWSALPGIGGLVFDSGARALLSVGSGTSADLYVGGLFTVSGGGSAGNVARWNGSAWAPLGTGLQGTLVESLASFDDGSGIGIFAGGTVQSAGPVHVDNVARWDGASWSAAGANNGISVPGFDENVFALAHFDDGQGDKLYVAGKFTAAGESASRSIARWDGSSWSSVGDVVGEVLALCVFDDGFGTQIYAGGQFSSIGGVAARSLARWNGSTWSALPHPVGVDLSTGSVVYALAVHDDGSGPALYVGGDVYIPSVSEFLVARWRNGAWSGVGSETQSCGGPGRVTGLVVHDDGSGPALYACGNGMQLDCVPYHGVAKWDGNAWSNLGSGVEYAGSWSYTKAIASHDDGNGPALFVGGSFTEAGGAPAANIARWKDGTWSPLGSGTMGEVLALASIDDGSGQGQGLYASGSFTSAGSVGGTRIARWRDGTWSALSGGIHSGGAVVGAVRALCAWNDGGGRDLYAGGRFTRAGSHASHNFARFEGCGETGEAFCYGDGSATACPCGNASAVGERAGCLHSLGFGATLRARGEPELSNDSLSLDGGSMTNSSALYFQAGNVANGGLGVPFGDGIKCTNGPFVRLSTKVNSSGASTYPEAGDLSVSVKGLIAGPGTRHYQVRYRNPAVFCTAETFNYTNAVTIVWRL